MDAFLDGTLREKTGDGYRAAHTDPMGTIDRLILDRRIPPTVKQENVTGIL